MDFWTPTFKGWGDDFNDAAMPWYTEYKWVEVQDYDHTTKQFKPRWKDNFESLDLSRWTVGNDWSYDGNSSRYFYSNTYVHRGDNKLTLRMNKKDWKNPKPNVLANETIFTFDRLCAGKDDKTLCGGCSDVANSCLWSWPKDDPMGYKSPQNQCRCLPRQRDSYGYTYSDKTESNKNQGNCNGCKECTSSYPTDDWKKWDSDEVMKRCRPEAESSIDWRWINSNNYQIGCGADCFECWGTDSKISGRQNHCKPSHIHEIIWGQQHCDKKNEGECGPYCDDCRHSWLTMNHDAGTNAGICRCKNWYGH